MASLLQLSGITHVEENVFHVFYADYCRDDRFQEFFLRRGFDMFKNSHWYEWAFTLFHIERVLGPMHFCIVVRMCGMSKAGVLKLVFFSQITLVQGKRKKEPVTLKRQCQIFAHRFPLTTSCFFYERMPANVINKNLHNRSSHKI